MKNVNKNVIEKNLKNICDFEFKGIEFGIIGLLCFVGYEVCFLECIFCFKIWRFCRLNGFYLQEQLYMTVFLFELVFYFILRCNWGT